MSETVASPSILVVDDDPEILTMLSLRLRKRGYRVMEASDGEQALSMVRQERPDVILLDVMMPALNGWEVARQLRQTASTRDVGIIMLTAIGDRVNEMTSPLFGADAFVDKPFDFDYLEEKIKAVYVARNTAGSA